MHSLKAEAHAKAHANHRICKVVPAGELKYNISVANTTQFHTIHVNNV